LIIFFLALPVNAQDSYQKFSLKLAGGFGNTTGGDMEAMQDGINENLADMAALEGFTVTDELKSLNWGPEFEGELIFHFTRHFGVSLGVESFRRKADSTGAIELGSLASLSLSWAPEYSAVPIKLSGYYFIPVGEKMKMFVKAGVGYYIAKIKYRVQVEERLLVETYMEQQTGEAKDNGFGLHGGLGMEYRIATNFDLFVEWMGRYVNLKDWDVENNTTSPWGDYYETGKFWYADEYNEVPDKYYGTIQMAKEMPGGPGFRNVRKAEISLSGITFRLGVKIRF
jgi:opacity protein-like surface antigen